MQAVSPVIEEIKNRRSIRSYDGRPVPESLVSKLLDSARFAPSALNSQPWKFIIVSDRGVIKKLSEAVKRVSRAILALYPLLRIFARKLSDPRVEAVLRKTAGSEKDTVFYDAPLLVFITAAKNDGSALRDCIFAAQNMMLAAHSVGLGSCFIGRGELLRLSPNARKLIGLPKGRDIAASIVFGYPRGEIPPAPPRRDGDMVNWIK